MDWILHLVQLWEYKLLILKSSYWETVSKHFVYETWLWVEIVYTRSSNGELIIETELRLLHKEMTFWACGSGFRRDFGPGTIASSWPFILLSFQINYNINENDNIHSSLHETNLWIVQFLNKWGNDSLILL